MGTAETFSERDSFLFIGHKTAPDPILILTIIELNSIIVAMYQVLYQPEKVC